MPQVSENLVLDMEKLAQDIFRITLESECISQNALPGQFVNVKCGGQEVLLRRPISICDIDRSNRTYKIVFQVRGQGTDILSKCRKGDALDVLGPLGKPFETDIKYSRIAVIGGGIGIFPLYFLLGETRAVVKRSYLGFRNKDFVVMEDEFNAVSSSLNISTDDGSKGSKGLVTDLLERDLQAMKPDILYACGPTPMLKRVAYLAESFVIPCQLSLEQRMGCGFGACLVCACRTKKEGKLDYSRVCKDGPVFWSSDVIFE